MNPHRLNYTDDSPPPRPDFATQLFNYIDKCKTKEIAAKTKVLERIVKIQRELIRIRDEEHEEVVRRDKERRRRERLGVVEKLHGNKKQPSIPKPSPKQIANITTTPTLNTTTRRTNSLQTLSSPSSSQRNTLLSTNQDSSQRNTLNGNKHDTVRDSQHEQRISEPSIIRSSESTKLAIPGITLHPTPTEDLKKQCLQPSLTVPQDSHQPSRHQPRKSTTDYGIRKSFLTNCINSNVEQSRLNQAFGKNSWVFRSEKEYLEFLERYKKPDDEIDDDEEDGDKERVRRKKLRNKETIVRDYDMTDLTNIKTELSKIEANVDQKYEKTRRYKSKVQAFLSEASGMKYGDTGNKDSKKVPVSLTEVPWEVEGSLYEGSLEERRSVRFERPRTTGEDFFAIMEREDIDDVDKDEEEGRTQMQMQTISPADPKQQDHVGHKPRRRRWQLLSHNPLRTVTGQEKVVYAQPIRQEVQANMFDMLKDRVRLWECAEFRVDEDGGEDMGGPGAEGVDEDYEEDELRYEYAAIV